MKILIYTLISVYSIAFSQDMKDMNMTKKEQKQVRGETATYTCIMHPEIHSARPGNCPKCGMALIRETPKKEKSTKQKKDHSPILKDSSEKKLMDRKMMQPSVKPDTNMYDSPKIMNQEVEHADQKPGKRVVYHLYVADTIVNYTGKAKHAIAINGSIPAPALYFTEGDTAEIYVHNTLKKETSIHWHGIILPNRYDGVSYLTTAPIKPGETHKFEFPVVQNGTYWYHSHTKTQEQSGMYGALIFYKRKEAEVKQIPVVLSDWTNEKPYEVHRSLHMATDWYAIKKRSTQNYGEAIRTG
ncbi:MAG: multicopper oxidase domain-containing protein, partial [Bacteroidota bacterium]